MITSLFPYHFIFLLVKCHYVHVNDPEDISGHFAQLGGAARRISECGVSPVGVTPEVW